MRPLAVTLIGFYQILRGVVGVLFGLSILLFTGLTAKLASLATEGGAVATYLRSFGHAAGIGVILFAAIHMLAGYGLLQMENWGRLLALLFSAIGLFMILPGLMHSHTLSVVFGAINAVIILYLVMPPVKRAFHSQTKGLRMAA
jgi:uncharacterized membrane protein (DUF2068 family)